MSKKDLPSGWSLVTLNDLRASGEYTFVGGPFGSDLTTSDYVTEPGVPVIRGTNLGGKESRFVDDGFVYVTERKAKLLRRNTAYPGDVVFTQRGTLGQVAVIPASARFERYVISQSQMKLTPDSSRIDSRFLYYFLRAPKTLARLLIKTQATGVPHINLGILKQFSIVLPPLAEQRRIAEVLDRAEALRAKRRAALAKVESLTQSLFLDLFGDPANNPKCWPIKQLGEVATEVYRYPTYYDISYEDDGVPEIRGELLKADGSIVTDRTQLRFISAKTSDHFPKTVLATGDLVMSVRGTIGKIGLVPPELAGANITANLIRIALDQTLLEPLFAWHVTQTSYFKAQITSASSSTTILTIRAPELKRLPVPLPPIDLQREFARRVQAVEKLKTVQRASLAELDALFASLQHRAFRGEL